MKNILKIVGAAGNLFRNGVRPGRVWIRFVFRARKFRNASRSCFRRARRAEISGDKRPGGDSRLRMKLPSVFVKKATKVNFERGSTQRDIRSEFKFGVLFIFLAVKFFVRGPLKPKTRPNRSPR